MKIYILRGTQIFLAKLQFFHQSLWLVQFCSFIFEARSTLSDLYVWEFIINYMYEIGNTSSLPFWRTSTLRRLHRPLSIISCIPAPCPEPPVWSLEAIMRHRHSEATRTGYGLARRRRYQPRPLGAPPSVDSIDDPFSLQSGRGAEKAHRNADARQLLLLRWKNYYGKKKSNQNKIRKTERPKEAAARRILW